mmetsp:Transcript_50188/g.92719  ORF Transcript_50188/g.92719 Transcript_50188/m.92719 type:complete len:134 (-) Transcript_50188:160-561(-)
MPAAETDLEKRKAEVERLQKKYPDSVPVIIQQAEPGSFRYSPWAARRDVPKLGRTRWLVKSDMQVHELNHWVCKELARDSEAGQSPSQTIYLFAGRTALKTSTKMSEVYEQNKEEDGFLYIQYRAENWLGAEA